MAKTGEIRNLIVAKCLTKFVLFD